MKLIKGSRTDGVDNSNPNYDPKLFRGSKKHQPSKKGRMFIFGVIFLAVIVGMTATLDQSLR